MKKLALIASLVFLAACGSRSVWEPANDNVVRYGSWTDEALVVSSTLGAVYLMLDQHPPSPGLRVAIRVPHDPESYAAAALLADGLERGGASVAWTADEGVVPSSSGVEVWEVATTTRGAVTLATHSDPPFRREALVEIRVSSVSPDGKLLWNARASGKAARLVNVYFAVRKSVPK